MNNKIKVGDTFRVFEVVKPYDDITNKKGKTGIEIEYNMKMKPTHFLNISVLSFYPEELKQVGTIRIKSLKNNS